MTGGMGIAAFRRTLRSSSALTTWLRTTCLRMRWSILWRLGMVCCRLHPTIPRMALSCRGPWMCQWMP
eukprot:5966646-Prorocentrum_lima.AAC.1